MTANPHPASGPYADRSASELLAYTKLHLRQTVADADEVRNTDFSGQYGGLYVRTIGANYGLDTEDLSADDLSDDSDTIIDGAGNHFVRVVDATDLVQRIVIASGSVTIASDDVDIVIIKKTVGAATAVQLPSAASRTKPVRIVDGKGDAATNNITISPQTGETNFAIVNYQYVIDRNGDAKTFTPLADGTGWI